MSIMITLLLDENNHNLRGKLAAFLEQNCEEIQILEIKNLPSIHQGETMLVLNAGNIFDSSGMTANITGIARKIDHSTVVNETIKKIGIVGGGLCLDDSMVFNRIIERFGHITEMIANDKTCYKPIVQSSEYCIFPYIKKIPIPAQCKKAKNNTRKR